MKKLNKSQIVQMLKVYAVLIVDVREQTNHIELFFSAPEKGKRQARKNVIRTQLQAGDYTFLIMPNEILGNSKPLDFRNDFIIEKKSGPIFEGGGFSEMKTNISGAGHNNFKKEFQFTTKNLILLLENTVSENDLFKCKRGKIPTKVYFKAYQSFISNRNFERKEKSLNAIEIVHCMQHQSGLKVKELMLKFCIDNILEIQNCK